MSPGSAFLVGDGIFICIALGLWATRPPERRRRCASWLAAGFFLLALVAVVLAGATFGLGREQAREFRWLAAGGFWGLVSFLPLGGTTLLFLLLRRLSK